jgi:hypothetical protein
LPPRCRAGLLDGYHAERHPVGEELAEHTLAQGALIMGTAPDGQALRSLLSGLLASQPALGRAIADKLAGLDVAYTSPDPAAHPLDGTRPPAAAYPRLFDLLQDGRPVLLDLRGTLGGAAARASSLGIETHPGPLAETGGPAWSGVGAAIIRPDGYVWRAVDASADLDAVVADRLDTLGATFATP